MDIVKRDQFIALWKKYFNDAELPVAFYYSKENNNATDREEGDGAYLYYSPAWAGSVKVNRFVSYRIQWDVAGESFTWDSVKV